MDATRARAIAAARRTAALGLLLGLELGALAQAPLVAQSATGARAPSAQTPAEAAPRRPPAPVRFPGAEAGGIAATVLSLPSGVVSTDEALALLGALHAVAPSRMLLVLTDDAGERALRAGARRLNVQLITSSRAGLSAAAGDAFRFARDASGVPLLVALPGSDLARELLRGLPRDLARAWGGPRVTETSAPPDIGSVLLSGDAAWVTLPILEDRMLAGLGLRSVPLADFDYPAGLDHWVKAAQAAAEEIGGFYARPARFLHALPERGDFATRRALLDTLRRGAGWDLRQLVTLLPTAAGATAATAAPAAPSAIVGDVRAGARWVAGVTDRELTDFASAYRLDAAQLGSTLATAQDERRAAGLGGFLDAIAAELVRAGIRVERLPLVVVPARLLTPSGEEDGELLLGGQSVALEQTAAGRRAEGFSSLVPGWDSLARDTFRRAGVALDLLPPLRAVVRRGHGYAAAANHLKTKQ